MTARWKGWGRNTYEGLADVGIDAGVCKRPMALTEFNLFLRAAKAEDCGSSIKSPYRHLYRYGYRSGSKSCKRRSGEVSQTGSQKRSKEDLQVNTGDSSSCTSLSICINMFTVISRSAKICKRL